MLHCDFCRRSKQETIATVKFEIAVDIDQHSERYVILLRYFVTNYVELCQFHYNQVMREFAFEPGDITRPEFSEKGFCTKGETVNKNILRATEQMDCGVS